MRYIFGYILTGAVYVAVLTLLLYLRADRSNRSNHANRSHYSHQSNHHSPHSPFAVPESYYYRGDGTWAPAIMVGARATADGVSGHVPPPLAGTHNSYLRGDGTWQFANNAPTAGQYCLAAVLDTANTLTITATPAPTSTLAPANTYIAPFAFAIPPIASSGPAISRPTTSQFGLAAGHTYKLTASLVFVDSSVSAEYGWYNQQTDTLIGIAGKTSTHASTPAIGYLTVTVPCTVVLVAVRDGRAVSQTLQTTQTTQTPQTLQSQLAVLRSFALLEVVSNNNTIGAFSGATTAMPGQQGYIPAPPAGAQNMFLRGDGTWAGGYANAPSAAQYYMANQPADTPLLARHPFVFATTPVYSAGSAITHSTPTDFVLRGGHTYKLTAAIVSAMPAAYQWYNCTTQSAIGNAGSDARAAMGFLTPVAATTVQLIISVADDGAYSHAPAGGAQCSWALLEVVSSNNVVAPFAGATADTGGLAGYIPAPPPGTHTAYLRGDGTWHTPETARLHAETTPGQCAVQSGDYVPFPAVLSTSGTAVAQVSPTIYAIDGGSKYRCTASCGMLVSGLEVLYVWYSISNNTQFGNVGQSTYNGVVATTPAIGVISPAAQEQIAVLVVSPGAATIMSDNRYSVMPHIIIEKI